MRRCIRTLLIAVSVGWSTPLDAQVLDWVSHLLTAARLPVITLEARREGIRDDEIRAALEAMRRSGVPAHEAVWVIDTSRVVRREHGPVDNFGAFVQSQLAAGKRGRELAAAIRAEHARQGKGNAARRGSDEGRGDENARGAPGQGRDRNDKARGAPDAGRGKADTSKGKGRGGAQPPGRRTPDAKPDDRGRGRSTPAISTRSAEVS